MFGSYRYLLALIVMSAHVISERGMHAVWASSYAVFAFYLLSGLLMAQVLDTAYRSPVEGTGRFLLNRVLRIYPPYWLVISLTAFLAWIAPDDAIRINASVRLPTSGQGWIQNLAIFGLKPAYETARLVPVAWSLSVELICYLCMAFGLARHPVVIRLWFIGSLAYTVYMVMAGYGPAARYFPVAAAFLPFSTGAMIYVYRDRLCGIVSPTATAIAAALFTANVLLPVTPGPLMNGRFYLALTLASVVTTGLFSLKRSNSDRWSRLDSRLGDLSYPIFLGHLLVALVLEAILSRGPGILPPSPLLFLCTWPLAHMFGSGVHMVVEAPMHALRGRVRGS